MKAAFKIVALLIFVGLSNLSIAQRSNPTDSLNYDSLLKWEKSFKYPPNEPSIMYKSGKYVDNLPIFCKIEHKLQIKSRIPVRIRLGDVSYVNKLESKF